MPASKLFYGWYVVGACFCLCFLFAGAGFYSFSIFIKPIESEFGWSRSAVSLTMSIYLVVGGLAGPLHGRLVQRYGPRRIMTLSAVASGACFLLVGLTRSLWYLYLVYALLAVAVCGMGIIPISTLLSNWFDKRRGTAIGMAMVGISAGGLLLAPCVGAVNAAWGWKASFLGIGLLVWVLALPMTIWVIRDRPAQAGAAAQSLPGQGDGSVGGVYTRIDVSIGWRAEAVLRSRSFWCIFIAFFLAPLAQMGVLQHQVPLIMDSGASESLAAAALGLTAGVGGLGKLSFGRISETWPFHYVVLLCFGLQAVAILILLHTHAAITVWVYAVVFGFSMGGVVVLLPLVVGHFWGLLSYGVILGMLFIANSLGGALGTYASGLLYDFLGDYRQALHLFAAAYVIAIIAFFAAGKPKREPAAEPPGRNRQRVNP
ncbi:MAG: MFS transporter [Desulfobacteraceae bacterium]|nr:MAG: MFS transporter [Desulfobacteraceae bacterium]